MTPLICFRLSDKDFSSTFFQLLGVVWWSDLKAIWCIKQWQYHWNKSHSLACLSSLLFFKTVQGNVTFGFFLKTNLISNFILKKFLFVYVLFSSNRMENMWHSRNTIWSIYLINWMCFLLLGKIQNVPLIWYWK